MLPPAILMQVLDSSHLASVVASELFFPPGPLQGPWKGGPQGGGDCRPVTLPSRVRGAPVGLDSAGSGWLGLARFLRFGLDLRWIWLDFNFYLDS